MRIISATPDEYGNYGSIQSWSELYPVPDGYVILTDDIDLSDYSGFVSLTVEDGIVVKMEPNAEALEKWESEHPQGEDNAERPPTQFEQMRADLDFLAAMQGVEL